MQRYAASGMYTYHNHTQWSDGRSSVDELIARAAELGVAELGVSDHLTIPPANRAPHWSMPREKLPAYVADVQRARAQHSAGASDMRVLLGVELDWFEDNEAELAEVLASQPLDYVIGSVHFLDDFAIDGNPHRWSRLSQPEIDGIFRAYWVQIRKLAEARIVDVIAHIDLPKKFGASPSEQPQELIDAAIDAIAAAGTAVEINTAGWHKACADAYPSEDIARRCSARQIPMLISADAHRPDDLLRDFSRAQDRLEAAGYPRDVPRLLQTRRERPNVK